MNENKPITLLREEFIQKLQDLCNSSGLPYFAISDVLKWLIPQIDDVARREAEKDKIIYKEKLKKKEETEKLKKEGFVS